jgi:TIR domain
VFISHRTEDLAQAEALASALSEDGHKVWLDALNIAIGDSIVDAIDKGLDDATDLLMCCSGAGHDSPWMSREWMAALARQLGGHGLRILPVVLPGGALPAILADIKYADLRSDYATGLEALKASLAV